MKLETIEDEISERTVIWTLPTYIFSNTISKLSNSKACNFRLKYIEIVLHKLDDLYNQTEDSWTKLLQKLLQLNKKHIIYTVKIVYTISSITIIIIISHKSSSIDNSNLADDCFSLALLN